MKLNNLSAMGFGNLLECAHERREPTSIDEGVPSIKVKEGIIVTRRGTEIKLGRQGIDGLLKRKLR